MKILITGGTGFIGSHLVDKLISDGKHELILMYRNKEKVKKYEDMGIETRYGDLDKPEELNGITKDVDVVVHLAAYMRFHAKWELLYRRNAVATMYLAEDAIKNGVQHFIYASSTEAIGPVKTVPADETHPYNPDYPYGLSKVMAEKILNRLKEEKGLPLTILRPTGVFGPGDLYITYSVVRAIANGKLSRLPGDGNKYVHFTYVDDVVQGFIKAIENRDKALGGTFIIASDDYHTYKEVFSIIAEILGVPPPEKTIPVAVAKLGVWFVELKNRLKGIDDFVFHTSVVRDMTKNRAYSNKKAKELLGFSPQYTFKDGMKITIDWYKENGYL
ncbi:MAG: NAD-dependent epimerase/dehydratase family protein [Candidatus Asgardarchaeia archaeon]